MALLSRDASTIAEVVISDMHNGEKCAIMYPDPAIDHKPRKWQEWSFDVFANHFLPDVEGLLNKYKADYVHLTTLGDMGSLRYKHGHPGEFWATIEDEVVTNTGKLLDPLLKMADEVHAVIGNDAHVGPGSKLDHAIAKDWDNLVPFNAEQSLHAHPGVDIEFQGKLFNYLHKGRNQTKWTGVNGMTSLSKEIALKRTLQGERIPDVVLRGHFHFGQQLRDLWPMPIALAGWKVRDPFVNYIDPTDETPHVGGQVIIIRDGEILESRCLRYQAERNRPWTPKL